MIYNTLKMYPPIIERMPENRPLWKVVAINMPSSVRPETILKNTFGYDAFKPFQREVIDNVLKKRDTLAILPTGGGKSLCYQIPALMFPGLTVVVSPLIALMKDQVEQLKQLGVPALFLNSSLSFNEYLENMARVQDGEVKLLYVAPETLMTPRLFNLLSNVQLDCLTIDEAHCISEWGHDFRPEYRQLAEVRSKFPKAVCLALTATATPRVREDIQSSLHFETSNEFVASFDRDNLLIEVTPKSDPATQTLQFLKRFPDQSGIIYCFSRKQVEDLATLLIRKGFSARPYHAGLADEDRRKNQEDFIRDDVQIMVATIAFGMGINKPNVRFVIHYDLPKSIESYYQEIGRAGRDGLPSHCLLLYGYGDVQKLKYFIDQKVESEQLVAYQHLNALVRYAESDICRRVPLLAHFGEKYTRENCGMCDVCLAGEKKLTDITVPVQKFLSCVKRTGEMFGAAHIIDVLMGSQNQKVTKFGHQSLSVYGIGKDLSRTQWQSISRQMIQKGLLDQDERYGSLKLTQRAYDLLKNKTAFQGILHEEPVTIAPKKTRADEHDAALFELLKIKRKELAGEAGVPPYMIFSDRSLLEMSARLPLSLDDFLKINGVGQVKARRYGASFLGVIGMYRSQNRPVAQETFPAPPPKTRGTGRHITIGEAYNNGDTIDDLAVRYQVQQGTILDHLAKFAVEGHPLRSGEDLFERVALPAGQQEQVLAAFQACGADLLKPVYDRLGGAVDYEDIKIMRLIYLSKTNSDE